MKKIFSQIVLLLVSIIAHGQNTLPKYDENQWRGNQYCQLMDAVSFSPVKELKNLTKADGSRVSTEELKIVFLRLDDQTYQQMKIDGWYNCKSLKRDDYYLIWNIYYTKISKEFWNAYCEPLTVLMELDGTIPKSKP